MIAVKPYQQPQSLNCFVTLFSKSLTQLLIAFILLLLEYNCFLRSGLVEKHNYQHFFFFSQSLVMFPSTYFYAHFGYGNTKM